MINIGITGGTGLVGPHLLAFLDKHKNEYSTILIGREDFIDDNKLKIKLKDCNIVVHLAGVSNRAKPSEIFSTNVNLTKSILDSLDYISHVPKIIFLSSIHRSKDTPYGISKKESEFLISNWGKKNNTSTTIIVSSHIFGESPHSFSEFSKPYTNSAFATFCHELVQNKESVVYPQAKAELIYVGDVCLSIIDSFKETPQQEVVFLNGREIFMTDVYALLKHFRDESFAGRTLTFNDSFEANLYNSFKSYLI